MVSGYSAGRAGFPALSAYNFWVQAAAKLVDAQAQGLARRVRGLVGIPHSDPAGIR